ncbi:MAG: response regulator transcription factor, partial [Anaerolineae bacterium]|nr:response regulator transcription factor [Anaerolineae bacterium]
MADRHPPPIPQARILMVDDEPTTRSAITRGLTLMGYRVDEAASGSQALDKLSSLPYDLMLLDLRMPGMDGVEVMKWVEQAQPGLLVIVLTAHASLESAIAAVQAGAANYLLKPCSIRDIEAAIARALQRRQKALHRQHLVGVIAEAVEALQVGGKQDTLAPSDRPLRFLRCGPVALDREKGMAAVRGPDDAGSLDTKLTTSEEALLAHLIQHPDTVFSCRQLARAALGYDVSEREAQDIVRPHIARLRKKIEPDPAHPRLIRTIRGKGYLF